MAKKRILLSNEDYLKLKRLMDNLKATQRLKGPHLRHLYDELKNAIVIDDEQVPAKRVILHAKVEYSNLNDETKHVAVIVFPSEADSEAHRYSILSPLGTALIGEEEKSVTICYAPAGEIPLRIDKVSHHSAAVK
ncbi:MAG TPA: transcription elongation factor GreAB [Sediminispirochaeta sp.]|nr:transcription elongation factor GreAB [Sediminispirochaeta sp.]